MKILIIGFTKLKYMPYANFYLDSIDQNNEVHLLYWNRDQKPENTLPYQWTTLHEFSFYQEDEIVKSQKIKSFFKYRKFVLKTLKENKFDFIIVLHTLPGILILDELKRHYSNSYILDYRDSTYEENRMFRKMIHILVHHAKTTFVSSDAFRKYLPQDADIHTSHNLLIDSLKYRNEKVEYGKSSDKIRIVFWGFIRHEKINREIIKKIGNDERFELHYYGREQEIALNLKNYATKIKATNVFFHGEYQPKERYEFVRHTDLIHNIYEDNNMMLAMGNKFYDGIIFYLPQLCMKGSFMGEISESAGVGKCFDVYSKDCFEEIYKYYTNLDYKKFYKNCDHELSIIIHDYRNGVNVINAITHKN